MLGYPQQSSSDKPTVMTTKTSTILPGQLYEKNLSKFSIFAFEDLPRPIEALIL
jgi:hypothetical protein